MNNPIRIIRRKDVLNMTGLSRSTMYEHIKSGSFPKPVKIAANSVGWVEAEIQDWIGLMIEARNAEVSPFKP